MINTSKSKYFNFRKIISNDEYNVFTYRGWNNVLIFRLDFLKNTFSKNLYNIIKDKNISKSNLEKVIVLTKGKLDLKNLKKKKKLTKFDFIH